MFKDKEVIASIAGGLIVGLTIGIFTGIPIGKSVGIRSMERQAIKAGVGERYIVDQVRGVMSFRWKERFQITNSWWSSEEAK